MLKSIILTVVVMISPSGLLQAEDFVMTKSGRLYGGKIVAESKTAITLRVLAEYLTFERDEIENSYTVDNTQDDRWHEQRKKEKAEAEKAKAKSDDKKTTSPPARKESRPVSPKQDGGQQDGLLQKVSDQVA